MANLRLDPGGGRCDYFRINEELLKMRRAGPQSEQPLPAASMRRISFGRVVLAESTLVIGDRRACATAPRGEIRPPARWPAGLYLSASLLGAVCASQSRRLFVTCRFRPSNFRPRIESSIAVSTPYVFRRGILGSASGPESAPSPRCKVERRRPVSSPLRVQLETLGGSSNGFSDAYFGLALIDYCR